MGFPSLRPSRLGQEPERKDGFMVTAEVIPYVLAIGSILAGGMGGLAKNFSDIEKERAALTLDIGQILAGRATTHTHISQHSISDIEKAIEGARSKYPGRNPSDALSDKALGINKISLN